MAPVVRDSGSKLLIVCSVVLGMDSVDDCAGGKYVLPGPDELPGYWEDAVSPPVPHLEF